MVGWEGGEFFTHHIPKKNIPKCLDPHRDHCNNECMNSNNDHMIPPLNLTASQRCMTAMRDLADYLSTHADLQLAPDYPFTPSFLDDDSDYMPAALDIMHELMTALTDDDSADACAELIARIERDDYTNSNPDLRYSEIALDCDLDPRLLPFADMPY
jgi:hypothetical protein